MYTATVTMHNRDAGATRDPQQSGILTNFGRFFGVVDSGISEDPSYLNIVNFETFVYLNAYLCRSASFNGVQIPMCPHEDLCFIR